MVSNNAKFHKSAQILCNDTNTPHTVKAGEQALLCLNNGSAKDNFDSLRYERYYEKVKKSSKPLKATCNLPPTSAVARYDSPRVYFQVNKEKGDIVFEAIEWGRIQTGTQDY